MNNFKMIVDRYSYTELTPALILQVLTELHTNACLTPTATTYLVDKIVSIYPIESKRESLKYYLLMYIKYFNNGHFPQNNDQVKQTEDDKIVEDGCEIDPNDVINLKPEDCRDMKYDVEFLKKIGWENPDGQ